MALIAVATAAAQAGTDKTTQAAPADFGSWPQGASPQEIGRRVAENFLHRPDMISPWDGSIAYPEVCVWYGALTFAKLDGDKPLQAALVKRYDGVMLPEHAKLISKLEHVNFSVFGAVPLEVYIQTGDANALALGKAKADKQWENPRKDGLSPQTRFWIDDMYLMTLLQVQAFRATGDKVYLDRAAKEMVAYLDKLQQPNGLFFHGDTGKFHWGRGNGWVAAGMTELLRELPESHPDRARILAGYRKMMAALVKNQDANGMWHQLVDRPDAWPETSCTGMFTFALITGVKNGWLDKETYGPPARKGWLALVGYLDNDANLHDVCIGLDQQPIAEKYLTAKKVVGDFHGQAPVLWCASALLRE